MDRHKKRPLLLLIAACLLAACATPGDFQHTFSGDATPRTRNAFDADPGRFTFAVHSDLASGERPGVFDIAIAQLNLLRPEFVMNVGDLIEGDTQDEAGLNEQWDAYDQRAMQARAPVFHTGGNHDLTGEVLQHVWEKRYGRRYYHFIYKNVLFLVLDTEDNTPERIREIYEIRANGIRVMDEQGNDAFRETAYFNLPERTAGNITEAQSKYFTDVIAANPGVRWTFLFMHKAPWLRPDEHNFAAIEEALKDRPYTVFHGHEHSYEYLRRGGHDYIRLATTGGAQLPGEARAMDHVTLVTVDDQGVDIANLLLEGILDRTGHIPLDGDDVCFEAARCKGTR